MAIGFRNNKVFGRNGGISWFQSKTALDIVVFTSLITMSGCDGSVEPDLQPEVDLRGAELDHVLIRGVTLQIRNSEEFPLEGATVAVYGGIVTRSTTTDSEGKFQLRIPRSTQFLLASAPGYWSLLQYIDPASPHSAAIEMSLVTDEFIQNEVSALGLTGDGTKGFIAIHFHGDKGGESAAIEATSQQPYSLADSKRIPGNRLPDKNLPEREGDLIFPFVDVGDTKVVVAGGPETVCTLPEGIEWPVIAKTVTAVDAECAELIEVRGRVVDVFGDNIFLAYVSVQLSVGKIGKYTVDFEGKTWDGGPLQFVTSEAGNFSVRVPPGTHFVSVSKIGHWGSVSVLKIGDADEDQQAERDYPVYPDRVIEEAMFAGEKSNKSRGIFALSSPVELRQAEIHRNNSSRILRGAWSPSSRSFWFPPVSIGEVTVVPGKPLDESRICHVTMNPWKVRANKVTIGTSICQDAQ